MLYSAKQADKSYAILGFANKDAVILCDDFKAAGCETIVTTDDGSYGIHGFVTDALKEIIDKVDEVCACGPTPMLKAVAALCRENGKPCQVSLEERMGCGIGACLGCVCNSAEVDDHSKVKNKRVCADGPVFLASEVEL